MTSSFVLSVLAGVTIATLLALASTGILRRSRAATRHALLAGALSVTLLLPCAALIAPAFTREVAVPAPMAVTEAMASFDWVSPATPAESVSASVETALPEAGPRSIGIGAMALGLWLTGLGLCLLPVVSGLREVRAVACTAVPWQDGQRLADTLAGTLRLQRRVAVVQHDDVSGPMTFGVWRPTIVVPIDAGTWPESDLIQALIHELEHIRRADWATQCVARVLCAVYWFHPLVWMARRRLVLEAERACDDAVLRCAEASAYAKQLVDLARRLSARQGPLLAMASRRDLATRVRALLDQRQVRGRTSGGLLASVAVIAAALIVAISPLRVVARSTSAQVPGDRPRFEVVSVKPCESGAPSQRRGDTSSPITSPGRLYLQCYSLAAMFTEAYLYFANGRASELGATMAVGVEGGPSWMKSDRFTIEATTPDARVPPAVMRGPMLQTILEDRFKLKFRRETRERPIYELVVASTGAKVTPYTGTDCVPRDYAVWPPVTLPEGQRYCGDQSFMNGDYFVRQGVITLNQLANFLAADRPVVNRTGIAELVSIRLEYLREGATMGGPPSASLVNALRNQLGLDLRPSTGPREFLVIEHAERPSPDNLVTR